MTAPWGTAAPDAVTVTMSADALRYISVLLDIDDDPQNAVDAGFSVDAYDEARRVVFARTMPDDDETGAER